MATKPMFSNTPASIIYAQSWPIPSPNSLSQRHPANYISNSQKENFYNSPWICKPKQDVKRSQKGASPASYKHYSWASSMLNSNYPGYIESDTYDMAKELKMTLQMFKKLTNQVNEVDEQLNATRKQYSFKRYFSKKNRYNTRKSNIRSFTPEIPMTNEEYQPCNSFNLKRDEHRSPYQCGNDRKAEKPCTNSSKSKKETRLLTNTEMTTRESRHTSEPCNSNDNRHTSQFQTEVFFRESTTNFNFDDEDMSWSSCIEPSEEDNRNGLGYIDPVPQDWHVRKLEELELGNMLEENDGDHFMTRYLELRRLEIETTEQEKGTNSSAVSRLENGITKITITKKESKKSTNAKKQCLKTNGNFPNENGGNVSYKTIVETPKKLETKENLKVARALKKSISSLQDSETQFENDRVRNVKKETKFSHKDKEKDTRHDKISASKTENNEKSSVRRSAEGTTKKRAQSCKTRQAPCRSPVTYDILELATTFDPPSKERIKKSNSRPITAKSAKSKGMIPGKTFTSQRRLSLTTGQGLRSWPSSDNSNAMIVGKSTTFSVKKSTSRTRAVKRCSSSKF